MKKCFLVIFINLFYLNYGIAQTDSIVHSTPIVNPIIEYARKYIIYYPGTFIQSSSNYVYGSKLQKCKLVSWDEILYSSSLSKVTYDIFHNSSNQVIKLKVTYYPIINNYRDYYEFDRDLNGQVSEFRKLTISPIDTILNDRFIFMNENGKIKTIRRIIPSFLDELYTVVYEGNKIKEYNPIINSNYQYYNFTYDSNSNLVESKRLSNGSSVQISHNYFTYSDKRNPLYLLDIPFLETIDNFIPYYFVSNTAWDTFLLPHGPGYYGESFNLFSSTINTFGYIETASATIYSKRRDYIFRYENCTY